MNWLELRDELAREIARFPEPPHEAWADYGEIAADWEEKFAQADFRSSAGIAAAVRHYARQGHWPSLSDEERRFLHVRLTWGEYLAGLLGGDAQFGLTKTFPIPPGLAEREDAIEWLLVDAWLACGAVMYGPKFRPAGARGKAS